MSSDNSVAQHPHKETIYYDVEPYRTSSGSSTPEQSPSRLEKNPTRYYDAQVLQFADEPLTERNGQKSKKAKKGGLFSCCCRPAVEDDETMRKMGGGGGQMCGADETARKRSSINKLQSIKEASLTKEQMQAQRAARRTETEFHSMGQTPGGFKEVLSQFEAEQARDNKGEVVEIQAMQPVQRKVSRTASIRRKLSNVLSKVSRRGSLVGSMSGGSMEVVEPEPLVKEGWLTDEEFEFYKHFQGWWAVDRNRSDSYASLVKVMKLSFAMKFAMDNSKYFYFDVGRQTVKNVVRIFGIVDLKEERPWSAQPIKTQRKDLRKGQAESRLTKIPKGFAWNNWWPEPVGGSSVETFEKVDDNTMLLTLDLKRNSGEECHLEMIFERETSM